MLSSAFLEWIKGNLPLVIGIAAAIVLIVIVIVVLAVNARKKLKNDSDNADVAPEDVSENESESSERESAENTVVPEQSADVSANEETKPSDELSFIANAADDNVNSDDVGLPEETEEKAPVTAAPSVKEKPGTEPVKQRKSGGRWTIEKKGDGEYMSKLSASNGEVMLSSEIYSSEDGARSGIATIIKCVSNGQFVIYRDKSGNYYYKLKTTNNRLLCVGEIYRAKDQCERAVETVKRIAADAVISDELVKGEEFIKYVPLKTDETVRTARGKWRVEKTEEGKYCARLFASNGQLMLATEEVATRKGAENSIAAVKRNAAEGNFVIDRDKFGRYYYKLRNSAKSVICIGETYEKLDSCMKAIESVRRFAATAVTGTAD